MDRTYPWFDYDTWLATEPDDCIHEDAEDEDEVYERWKDEQVDDD